MKTFINNKALRKSFGFLAIFCMILSVLSFSVSAMKVDIPYEFMELDGWRYCEGIRIETADQPSDINKYWYWYGDENNPKIGGIDVEIIYTGKEYLKYERSNPDISIYKSSDREAWEYIKTVSRPLDGIFPFDSPFPIVSYNQPKQIINTGKEYLIRSTRLDNGYDKYGYTQPIYVADLDFNFVKQIDAPGDAIDIVDMSYLNDIYYITTEKCITYKSTDLENWEVLGKNIACPKTNGIATVYFSREQMFIRDWFVASDYEGPITYKNGLPDKNVVTESIELYNTRACGDFFVGYSNGKQDDAKYRNDGNITGLNGELINIKRNQYTSENPRVSFSKDGIYWATIEIPGEAGIRSIDHTKDYLLVETNGYILYTFKFSDMEAVVPRSDLRIQMNNHILGFETPPVMENDRTLVPMRFLFEQMGASVDWNPETETATATLTSSARGGGGGQDRAGESNAVTFSIDDTTAIVNGKPNTMDVPARLINDKTMVPLRFLSENLGYTVTWDEETNTAIIE